MRIFWQQSKHPFFIVFNSIQFRYCSILVPKDIQLLIRAIFVLFSRTWEMQIQRLYPHAVLHAVSNKIDFTASKLNAKYKSEMVATVIFLRAWEFIVRNLVCSREQNLIILFQENDDNELVHFSRFKLKELARTLQYRFLCLIALKIVAARHELVQRRKGDCYHAGIHVKTTRSVKSFFWFDWFFCLDSLHITTVGINYIEGITKFTIWYNYSF